MDAEDRVDLVNAADAAGARFAHALEGAQTNKVDTASKCRQPHPSSMAAMALSSAIELRRQTEPIHACRNL